MKSECDPTYEVKRQLLLKRKAQISLLAAIGLKLLDEPCIQSDRRINADMFLERREIEEHGPVPEGGHVVADAARLSSEGNSASTFA